MSKKPFRVQDIALNRIKLRPLVIFHQVVQSGSVLRAAKALSLSQPAVTKAIQELESELGATLFNRTNKGVFPSDAGQILAHRVSSLFTELRYLIDDLNSFNNGNSGHIVIGSVLSGGEYLIPEAILKLKQDNPGIVVSIKIASINELYLSLSKGELDMVVGRLPRPHSPFYSKYNFIHQPIYEERLCLVTSTANPNIEKYLQSGQLSDLSELNWILPHDGSSMRESINEYFISHDVHIPANIVESTSLLTNIKLISKGHFIAFMPELISKSYCEMGILQILSTKEFTELDSVGISYNQDRTLSSACLNFIKALENTNPYLNQ
ncbi:LysR family transcriptional regulator [Acinetobacter sp. WZC-1]|uniref:LysR family transcriptional regulator n=1 Tax=Acinetobacter sp. WZC-1 TaxID=3459034 RepID=UPI00403DA41E